MTPRPVGRPAKLDPERVARFVEATSVGATRALAAKAAGWAPSTAYCYLAAGRDALDAQAQGARLTAHQRALAAFAHDVDHAEGRSAMGALACIVRAAQRGEWTAAAWLLERRYGYQRHQAVEVTGVDGGPVAMDVSMDTEISAAKILEALAELRAQGESPNGMG